MAQLINVRLNRVDAQPWGLRLQGGKDFGTPLVVQKVSDFYLFSFELVCKRKCALTYAARQCLNFFSSLVWNLFVVAVIVVIAVVVIIIIFHFYFASSVYSRPHLYVHVCKQSQSIV